MSSSSTDFTEEQESQPAETPLNKYYIPTEAEKRLFKECNRESFYYRSVPLSVVGMVVTHVLVARGTLSASPRFGSIPKVVYAALCGYIAGKVSYVETCREKFRRLENSSRGDVVRQKIGQPPLESRGPQSALSDPDTQSFEPIFQPAEAPSHMSTYSKDYGYGYNPEPPAQIDKGDDFSAPVQSYVEEEEPKRKSILYEDLRLKNRENYEVTLTQKADGLLKTPPTKEPERPKKEMKNIYGDTWEE